MADQMSRTITCKSHCGACGAHFSSTRAFDTHRTGSHSNPDDPRRCEHPLDVNDTAGREVFVRLADVGECRMYAETREGTVWALAASLERAAERFGNTPETFRGTPGYDA